MPRPELPPDLLRVLAHLDDTSDMARLLGDLLTPSELESLSERWAIVTLLARGDSQRTVRDKVGCSVTTVSRGNRQLRYGEGGFERAFDALVELGEPDPRYRD